MKISRSYKDKNRGFTLVELIVVVAGLAALASFSIPNVLKRIKQNRVEETKAIMNGYAADCLIKFRETNDTVNFIENAAPDQLDNTKLATLGYVIDGNKNKCTHLEITPLNQNEEDLFAFGFRMTGEGLVLKIASPSNNPRFLSSCEGWAGQNCGLSAAQQAEFERLAALAKAKSECYSKYNKWLSDGSSGENVSWDIDNETCTKKVFAFEGIPVNSLEAVEAALKAKYGRACADWRVTKKNSNIVDSNPQTLDPECGGVDYWFHSGLEFTTQVAWTAYDNQLKEQACIKDRSDALSGGINGKYTYGPTPGPDPCGKVVWLCNNEEYASESGYLSSACGTPPPPPIPPPPPAPPQYCPEPAKYLCSMGLSEWCTKAASCP